MPAGIRGEVLYAHRQLVACRRHPFVSLHCWWTGLGTFQRTDADGSDVQLLLQEGVYRHLTLVATAPACASRRQGYELAGVGHGQGAPEGGHEARADPW